LKHTTQTVQSTVKAIRYRLEINTLEKQPAPRLQLNDIGAVVIETQRPIFCDPYRRNRATGSFILIDPLSNATVAAGMITGRELESRPEGPSGSERFPAGGHRITRLEQQSRAGHRAATIWLEAAPEVVYELERRLFRANYRVHALVGEGQFLPEVCRALNEAGVIALVGATSDSATRERIRQLVGEESFLAVEGLPPAELAELAADQICRMLALQGFAPDFLPLR
jgi:hypothetical protein